MKMYEGVGWAWRSMRKYYALFSSRKLVASKSDAVSLVGRTPQAPQAPPRKRSRRRETVVPFSHSLQPSTFDQRSMTARSPIAIHAAARFARQASNLYQKDVNAALARQRGGV